MVEIDYKLIIFDADGTLRRCTVEGQPCPNKPGEWELMPNVKETLARINWGSPHVGGVAYGIASNQAGVALGYMTEEMAYRLLKDMTVEAFGGWPTTGTIQVCPHAPDANCACRKPKPLMLRRLMKSWMLPPSKALYVGDMESDKQAAKNAECHFMWASEFFRGQVELKPCPGQARCPSPIAIISKHAWHCPECDEHLTSGLFCPSCGTRYHITGILAEPEKAG